MFEQFIAKPNNSMAFIENMKKLNKNEAQSQVDRLKGTLYWVEKGASWVKPYQEHKYVTRGNKIITLVEKLIEKNFFLPERTRYENVLQRTSCLDMNMFDRIYIQNNNHVIHYSNGFVKLIELPDKLTLVEYCEGDVFIIECNDKKSLTNELTYRMNWFKQA